MSLPATAHIRKLLHEISPGWAQDDRVGMLAEMESIYADNDVLVDAFGPALHKACPSRGVCWAKDADRKPPVVVAEDGSGEYGSIAWPWIGQRYERGGLCMVTLNMNTSVGDGWSVGNEYWIVREVLDCLSRP